MKTLKRLGIFASVFLLVALIYKSFDHTSAKVNTAPSHASVKTTTTYKINSVSLASSIDQDISSDSDDLSAAVSVIDLNTGTTVDAGAATTLYKAASTAKVLAAVDYLHQVQLGAASLNEDIDGSSAQQLVEQMIEVSNDQDWADIDNFLGNQQQTYADDIGLSSFTGGEYNTMTASDMAKLLAMLYQGKLLNKTYQQLLLNYMANTTSTNLIQAVLPSNATVYHKYGQLWGYLNDAAIISYENHNYVLVIYTNNSDGTTDEDDDQIGLIHSVSKLVFTDIIEDKV